jgi:thioredoxin 1
MTTKGLITALLLGFVATSVVTMIWKETRPTSLAALETPGSAPQAAEGPTLIAYYFHGTIRCVTCNAIETTAKQAIDNAFAQELESGRISWQVVNYEERGNEHFAIDYQLVAPSVVLVSMRGGREQSWTNLPEVWELVGDTPKFRQFIQDRVAEYLSDDAPTTASVSTSGTADARSAAERGEPAQASSLPLLLDLGAKHCIPCKMMAPILDELEEQYQGRFDVVFIDVFEDPAAAERFGVTTIPTQIFFDAEGREQFRHVGFFSKDEILTKWKDLGVEVEVDLDAS